MIREKFFTKEHTMVIKGIAILLMLWHHLFFGQLATPIHWLGGDTFRQIFATIFKVCVSIFAILSGYGLTEQYKKKPKSESDLDFAFKKTWKLLKEFWGVFFIVFILGFFLGEKPTDVYGTGMLGFFHFLLDSTGLAAATQNPTMNFSWWYIEAALCFYIFHPLLYKAVKKIPYIIFPITFFLFAKYGASHCREIFWLFPFCVGILYSEQDFLNSYLRRYNNGNEERQIGYKVKNIVAVLIYTLLRSKLGIIIDVLLAIKIIKFASLFIMNRKPIKVPLKILGRHSANIFMVHSFIYYYFAVIAKPFNAIPTWILQYIVLVLASLAFSVVIEFIKFWFGELFEKIKSTPFYITYIAKETV